jgi:hypothetical protein
MSPRSPFCFEDLNLSLTEFHLAMEQMLANGLVSSFIKDGTVYYQLTDIGYAIGEHLVSDKKMVN